MAYHYHQPQPQPQPLHHHQNHHISTTSYCYCQQQQPPPPLSPCQHPPPPLPTTTTTTTDPYHVASIITQLLQPQPQPQHHTHTQTQRDPHPHPHPHPHSPIIFSLLERIEALEASIRRFSYGTGTGTTTTSFCLRHVAARTIQSHYRAHLVFRSRTLAQLQHLASIKSSLASLKSCVSRHPFLHFDFLSTNAMDLLLTLDSIQSDNKMIKDSKRAVTKEIVEFLDSVDGVCVKRHQVLTRKVKNLRLVRDDVNRGVRVHERDRDVNRGLSEHNVGSKSRNVGAEEKKLIANLRERVEKIGRMTKMLEEQDEDEVYGNGNAEIKGFKHVDDEEDEDIIDQIAESYRLKKGLNTKKNAQSSNGKKRVCFVEDGNAIKFFDIIDGGSRSGSRLVEVIEDTNKGSQDEEEAPSDADGSSNSSGSMRKGTSDEVIEECDNQEDEFTFANPELAKLDPRADFMSRKSGVKIVG